MIANGLGDLRLRDDAAGREVPYLFVWPTEQPPTWRGGRIIPVSPGKDTSGFELDLGSVTTIDRFEIPSLPDRFLKRVRLEGSGDRIRWTRLVADGTLFNLPNEGGAMPLRQTQLAFAPGAYRYLRLISDDHAGQRLATPAIARARVAPRGAPATDTLRMWLSFERRPSAARTSRYHVRLPATRLPIIALQLEVSAPQVLRAARVTEPRLTAERVSPTELGGTTLRRTSSDGAVASDLRIPIVPPTGAEIDIVISDLDNPPLDVRGVRAIFAPLPYIFFESANGAALRATFGTSRREPVSPPRYDLEALRDTVNDIAAAAAAWGAPRALNAEAVAAAPSALFAAPGAPLDAGGFNYARAIPKGVGLTAVRLDAAALAHSRIDDVRIVDDKGRQVPYLLEQLDEPIELALPPLEPTSASTSIDARGIPGAASRTWYRLRLPYTGLPDASLRLGTSARVFTRDIGVIIRELPRDAAPGAGADRTAGATWTHSDPDTPAPLLDIPLTGRLRTDSLLVLVDDGDNSKLALEKPTLLLPSYRLRFFRQEGASLRLLYGKADLGAPRYDIELIAPRLLDAAAEEVTADPEPAGAVSFGPRAKVVFWGVLGVVVVVLLLLIARLVRAGPPGGD